MTKMSEIKNYQIENLDLGALEKVTGGDFLTPEDQEKAYQYVMATEPDDFISQRIGELKWGFYQSTIAWHEEKVTYEEWCQQLWDLAVKTLRSEMW